jgi:hypothetical protein
MDGDGEVGRASFSTFGWWSVLSVFVEEAPEVVGWTEVVAPVLFVLALFGVRNNAFFASAVISRINLAISACFSGDCACLLDSRGRRLGFILHIKV